MIVAAAMLVGLVVAILKPWDFAAAPHVVPTASLPAAAVSVAPSPTIASAAPTPELPADVGIYWAEVTPADDGDGSFAIDVLRVDRSRGVGSAGRATFVEETWTPAPEGSTVLGDGARPIVALGVRTFPWNIATDLRIWRVRAEGRLEWVDARPVDGAPAGQPLVFQLPGRAIPFPAGRYRIDALVDGAIQRLDVAISDASGQIPPLSDTPYPSVAGLVPLDASDPSDVLSGPFAVVDGHGVPLDVMPVDSFDETDAWEASLAALQVAERPMVARLYLPRATGFGVMLPSHARIQSAEIRRLAPDDVLADAVVHGGVSSNHGGSPWIGFAAPGGGAWEPGVYAMTVAWTDSLGTHSETWHVELRPGRSTPSAPAPG